jgi:hypothetical protein
VKQNYPPKNATIKQRCDRTSTAIKVNAIIFMQQKFLEMFRGRFHAVHYATATIRPKTPDES